METHYIVLVSKLSVDDLVDGVNKWIDKGYVPVGGLVIEQGMIGMATRYYQSMVRLPSKVCI